MLIHYKAKRALVGNNLCLVRNSDEFSVFVRTQVLDETECLILFDVVSLFTQIRVKLAISVAKLCLESDNTLQDRTCQLVSSIVSLLRLCLEATYFSFRGGTYQQVFGTAMGFGNDNQSCYKKCRRKGLEFLS